MKMRYVGLILLLLMIAVVYWSSRSADTETENMPGMDHPTEQHPASNPTASPTAEGNTNSEPGTYQTLTIDEFASTLENQSDQYTVINVHIPYEGEIEGTDAQVAYNDLSALMAALPDKNAPIILYCRSGRMSQIASEALIEQGYTHVWDVTGGMIAWEESGRSLQN
ncbi:MAG: hypothetical protein K8I82_05805 [Anaerolineae bacterium]|nr:hypothetical protein [Anaerolineae bacterium]